MCSEISEYWFSIKECLKNQQCVSKAVWNFSENSSVLEEVGFPKPSASFVQFWSFCSCFKFLFVEGCWKAEGGLFHHQLILDDDASGGKTMCLLLLGHVSAQVRSCCDLKSHGWVASVHFFILPPSFSFSLISSSYSAFSERKKAGFRFLCQQITFVIVILLGNRASLA